MHRTTRTRSHRRRPATRSTRSLRTWPLKDRPSPLRSSSTRHRRRCRIDRPRSRLRHNHAPNRSSRRRSRSLNRRLHRSNRCRSRSLSHHRSRNRRSLHHRSLRRRRSRNHRRRSRYGGRHDRFSHHRSRSSRHNCRLLMPFSRGRRTHNHRANRRLARNSRCRRSNRNNVCLLTWLRHNPPRRYRLSRSRRTGGHTRHAGCAT
jgi:hypothetical protein